MYYYESEMRSREAELRKAAHQWRQAQEARRGRGHGQHEAAGPARVRAVSRLRAVLRLRAAA